jgi:hypothetical protein
MVVTEQLENVEIVWWDDWYDGPLTGLARHGRDEHWFEVERLDGDAQFDLNSATRRLFLYPLSSEELAAEKVFHAPWKERGQGRPVSEWPDALLVDDRGAARWAGSLRRSCRARRTSPGPTFGSVP